MKKTNSILRGRFEGETSLLMQRFSASIDVDSKLAIYDIIGSMAHARMLAKVKLINQKECNQIVKGLATIRQKMEKGLFTWREDLEDVHMNIEAALIDMIGDVGRKLHTARSRNDQVMLDVFLYLKDAVTSIIGYLVNLEIQLLKTAVNAKDCVMSGYTHLQHAQPVLLAHHMLAYIEMFHRDQSRFEGSLKRLALCPLGATALAGTSLPIDRFYLAKQLGFDAPSRNSMDSVSDRDMLMEVMSNIAITGVHLSRLAEEFVLWSTSEFSFIKLHDQHTTGSSAMPQKRNPDAVELVRGKSSRLIGNLVTELSLLKGLPLTYNRDLQEDKKFLFDSVETIQLCLSIMQEVLAKAQWQYDHMQASVFDDGSIALDFAEYLVAKGVPFRKAYQLVAQTVKEAHGEGLTLDQMSLESLKKISPVFDTDISKRQEAIYSPNFKKSYGSTQPKEVQRQIQFWKKKLNIKEFS